MTYISSAPCQDHIHCVYTWYCFCTSVSQRQYSMGEKARSILVIFTTDSIVRAAQAASCLYRANHKC